MNGPVRRQARSSRFLLCRLLGDLGRWSWFDPLRNLLGGKLLPQLAGDGIGIHLVCLGCGAENLTAVRLRLGRKQNDDPHHQLAEGALVSLAKEWGQQFAGGFALLRPDAQAPCDQRHTALVEQGQEAFDDEEQVALHQSNWNGGDDALQYPRSGRMSQCLLPAALFLLGFEAAIGSG